MKSLKEMTCEWTNSEFFLRCLPGFIKNQDVQLPAASEEGIKDMFQSVYIIHCHISIDTKEFLQKSHGVKCYKFSAP